MFGGVVDRLLKCSLSDAIRKIRSIWLILVTLTEEYLKAGSKPSIIRFDFTVDRVGDRQGYGFSLVKTTSTNM